MAPQPIALPCTLALTSPSHRNASTLCPCWAPHLMTQECLMFSNPTPSEPRLSPAATMRDDMLSALTPPLPCACILQPATPPQVVAFESWTISASICLNCFTFAEPRVDNWWNRCFCNRGEPDDQTELAGLDRNRIRFLTARNSRDLGRFCSCHPLPVPPTLE